MTEEVKIYQQHGIKEPALSEGEKAAREYRRQQQNGNLERAHRLGENLCALFLGMPVEPDVCTLTVSSSLNHSVRKSASDARKLSLSVGLRKRICSRLKQPAVARASSAV